MKAGGETVLKEPGQAWPWLPVHERHIAFAWQRCFGREVEVGGTIIIIMPRLCVLLVDSEQETRKEATGLLHCDLCKTQPPQPPLLLSSYLSTGDLFPSLFGRRTWTDICVDRQRHFVTLTFVTWRGQRLAHTFLLPTFHLPCLPAACAMPALPVQPALPSLPACHLLPTFLLPSILWQWTLPPSSACWRQTHCRPLYRFNTYHHCLPWLAFCPASPAWQLSGWQRCPISSSALQQAPSLLLYACKHSIAPAFPSSLLPIYMFGSSSYEPSSTYGFGSERDGGPLKHMVLVVLTAFL